MRTDESDFLRKELGMRKRRIGILIPLLGLATLLGCTPVQDGWTEGITDGVSAATSTFIEELATALFAPVVPNGGA